MGFTDLNNSGLKIVYITDGSTHKTQKLRNYISSNIIRIITFQYSQYSTVIYYNVT